MSRFAGIFVFLLSSFIPSGAIGSGPSFVKGDNSVPSPPAAKKIPKIEMLHGERREDDYFWLREKSNPEVAAYLEAENAYSDTVMAPTKPLQDKLYAEMMSHIKQTDENVPYPYGGWFYYSRTEEGKQYPIYCRKKGSLDAREEVILDLNDLAKGEKFLGLGGFQVSDDGRLLAYSTDTTGFRQYTMYVKDLTSGEVLPDRAYKTGSITWAADNRTLFYTVEDAAKRHYRVYRHRLGEQNDPLVYEEKDEMFNVYVSRSRSKRFIFMTSGSHTTSEERYLPADNPAGEWRLIAPREPNHEYYADHRGDLFYIRTNSGGRNFRLVTAPIATPGRQNWKEIVPHRDSVMLEGLELFANHLVLIERENGLIAMRVMNLKSGKSRYIRFPEPAYAAGSDVNREWDTTAFRYSYQSFVTPRSTFDFDMSRGGSKLLKQVEVPGGFDRNNYRSERIYATATDGVRVPISLVYRKGVKRDGAAPLHLYAYGSYGSPQSATFNSNRLSLLDRGVVFALAHIRGGGEMGKKWHDEGRMMKKMNTFTDFIACAEHLVNEKYCAKDRLTIEGGSAGGLLMGAVTNMRPDLFKAVVSHVPFVDVINTMMDPSLPLTVPEYEEWGNPHKKAEYDYMKRYCPYTNLAAKGYPAMLVKTSFNDSQVMYWEPAKYTAKLRTLKTDTNPLLLKTNMAAGHGGASGRYDYLKEIALDYAFILTQQGMEITR